MSHRSNRRPVAGTDALSARGLVAAQGCRTMPVRLLRPRILLIEDALRRIALFRNWLGAQGGTGADPLHVHRQAAGRRSHRAQCGFQCPPNSHGRAGQSEVRWVAG